jgi:hypothetical protein
VTIGIDLRSALAGGALALALALSPATAMAAKKVKVQPANGGAPETFVCNEAGAAFLGGTLDVIDMDADPNPPARYKHELKPLPGIGVGLVNAAWQSPALALCGATVDETDPDGDGELGGEGGEDGPVGGEGSGGGGMGSGDNG